MSTGQAPRTRILMFVGPLNYPAIKNLRNAICGAVNENITDLTLLFSSGGGALNEAIALYHFIRSLPMTITIHSIGDVDSSANIVFLATARRFCCSNSRFTMHSLEWTYGEKTVLLPERMHEHLDSIRWYEGRFIEILQSNTTISDVDLQSLKIFDKATIIDPVRAQQMGIVNQVQDAIVPAGVQVFNIDY